MASTYTPYSSYLNDTVQKPKTYTGMSNTTNPNAVNSQINKAANTMSSAQYQTPDALSKTTQAVMGSLDPMLRSTNAQINQTYNNSQRSLADHLAASGYQQSGGVDRNAFSGLQMGRNTALANANSNMLAQSLAAAQQQQNTALSERGLLQGQQSTAANQLASLLGQQTSDQQYGAQFNANQNQQLASNAFTEAGLTGAYGGQQTEAAKINAANITQAQQQTQQAAQANTANIAQVQQQAQQAALNAYMNYNLGVGGVTDSLPVIQGFNYGDYLKQMLAKQQAAIA